MTEKCDDGTEVATQYALNMHRCADERCRKIKDTFYSVKRNIFL
jgi:hypothetical protein